MHFDSLQTEISISADVVLPLEETFLRKLLKVKQNLTWVVPAIHFLPGYLKNTPSIWHRCGGLRIPGDAGGAVEVGWGCSAETGASCERRFQVAE